MNGGGVTAGPPPNEDGMLLLEASFARVPHEELRRHLRTQQRHVERDLAFCSSTLQPFFQTAKQSLVPGNASSQLPSASSSSLPSADISGGPSPAAPDVSINADSSFLGDVSFSSEGASFLSTGNDLSAAVAAAKTEPDDVDKKRTDFDKALDLMIGRVQGLKRKISNVHDLAGPAVTRLDARTRHLGELQKIQSITSPSFEDWCRTRLDRMIVDWLLRKGHSSTAQKLAESKGIENYTELSLFEEITRVENSLAGKAWYDDDIRWGVHSSCGPALAWCSENKATLRKNKSTLEFDLRMQEFIELARVRTPESLREALAYCKRHLLSYLVPPAKSTGADDKDNEKDDAEDAEQAESLRKQVSRAMGLLACGPGSPLYQDLYDRGRYEKLCEEFRRAALQIHSLPRQSTLHIALSAGLSSLKLPACYAEDNSAAAAAVPHLGGRQFGDDLRKILSASGVTSTSISAPAFPPAAGIGATESASSVPGIVKAEPGSASHSHAHPRHSNKNSNCPVCDTDGLGVLAKEVPWSHHANSTLVCAISGKIMNENDPPMVLPNGRVYSAGALQELAAASQSGETIVCPRTGDPFHIKELRKVYIS